MKGLHDKTHSVSCDEQVLSDAAARREDIKKQYAESLFRYALKQNGYVMTPLTFGEPDAQAYETGDFYILIPTEGWRRTGPDLCMSTGAHLHFAVSYGSKYINPWDYLTPQQ